MKLRRNEFCPIHRSLFCCGREQARKERRFQLGVQRIEDPHHPRGYRELRSRAEMRLCRMRHNRMYADSRIMPSALYRPFTAPPSQRSSPCESPVVFGIILPSFPGDKARKNGGADATQSLAREADSGQPVGMSASNIRNVPAGKRLSNKNHSRQVVLAGVLWVVVGAKQTYDGRY